MTAPTEPDFPTVLDWRTYTDDDGLTPLLRAGLELFVRHGYHATSVRMIAQQADMTVPGLYYHFATKRDIMLELVHRAHSELHARTRAALAEAGPEPHARFVAFIENVVLFMTYRWRMSLIPRDFEPVTTDFVDEFRSLRDATQDALVEIVEAGVAAGDFHCQHARGAARAILVMCRGVAQWFSPDGQQTCEDVADEYVRYALALVGYPGVST